MVHPRHVICALGTWTDLAGVDKAVRSTGGRGFLMDHDSSRCEADPRMGKAFVASADRVKPSLLHEDHAAIAKHRAVVYVLSPYIVAAQAQEISTRMLAVVAGLFQAGAVAVKGESSGIAHGAARWRALAARVGFGAGPRLGATADQRRRPLVLVRHALARRTRSRDRRKQERPR
jgi:hypothetical protein